MNKVRASGFSLVEILLALALGLILLLGFSRLLMATQGSYLAQDAAMRMQEDARFLLHKLAQEIRMAGMYGCTAFDPAVTPPKDFKQPVGWDSGKKTLTLITADVAATGSAPGWTALSDCTAAAALHTGKVTRPDQVSFYLRQLVYVHKGDELLLAGRGLAENVKAFDVSFGLAGSPMSYSPQLPPGRASDLRSVRLSLTLSDPQQRVADQTWHLVVALRNGWRL
jgi:type IV pilus assembly protein PilW